jgi:iron complex outermembrane recepter protein
MSKWGRVLSPLMLTALAAALSAPPCARADADAGAESSQVTSLEEVVVTATRREESIERVPISINALSQNDLAQAGIKDITDLAAATPGLEFGISGNGFSSQFTSLTIRGMNSNTGSPVVGVYLDDTPLQTRYSGSGVALTGMPYPVVFDLNRIEVERGPQGTLFGADSEAGAVRYITNQPSVTEFSGFTHEELAETEKGGLSYEVGAAAGGPIVDNVLGFRVSAYDRQDGGYVDLVDPITRDVVTPNSNTNRKDAFRGALLFETDGLKITPSLHYQEYKQGDSGRFYPIFSDVSDGYFAGGRLLPERADDRLAVASLKVEAALSFADLTSATSYTSRHNAGTLDAGAGDGAYDAPIGYGSPLGAPFPVSPTNVSDTWYGQHMHAITEEVRLVSNKPQAFINWVGGIFFDHRAQQDYQYQYSPSAILYSPLGTQVYNYDETSYDDQIAAYAQIDAHLSEKWTLTLGERVARVKTNMIERVVPNLFFEVGIPPVTNVTVKETPSTPKMTLTYQADLHNLYYASIGEGFRLGGGNAGLASICSVTSAADTFKSDHDWSYEVGAKNGLFDDRLQIDTSVFHILWYDIQQAELVPNCGGVYTNNVGYAVSNGFDLSAHALITQHLRLNLNIGYADAHFTGTVLGPGGNPIVENGDSIGLVPQVNAPWNVNTSAVYDVPLSHGDGLQFRADYQYQSRNPGPFLTEIVGSSNYFPGLPPNPPTHLTNARVTYTRGKVEAAAFVNNVFDAHPLLGAYQDAPNEVLTTFNTFRPRTVGVSLNIAF